MWTTSELLPPSLIVTQLAKMSYWLPAAITPEKMCHSYFLSKMYVVHTHRQRKPFHNTKSFHSYSYTWECPFSTLLWEFYSCPRFYWCTKNIWYKKVSYRESNFMDAWQEWGYVATKHQVPYPECWFHIPGENLFLLFLKFPKLWNQLLKFQLKLP